MSDLYAIVPGEIRAESSRAFAAGDGYLVLLVTEGSCRVRSGGMDQLVTPTDMLLLKPGTVREADTLGLGAACALTAVHIAPQALVRCSDAQCDLTEKYAFAPADLSVVHGDANTVVTLKNVAARLAGLWDDELPLGLSIYEMSLLSTFLVLFLRACVTSDRVYRSRRRSRLIIDDVFLFIRSHLAEDLSAARLEKEFFVSGEHLMRSFRREAGMTLHAYVRRSRIDLAKRCILQGMPIRQVCSRCGFGSYNHFFRAFREEVGMSPKAFFRQASQRV